MLFTTSDSSLGYALEKAKLVMLPYLSHLQNVAKNNTYDLIEASLVLPSDAVLIKTVTKLVQEKVSAKLKYVIDIGIGGSNLGTKAIYDALYGYVDRYSPDRFPKMVFADTVSPLLLHALTQWVTKTVTDPEEILISIISKSGSTTETVANAEIIIASLAAQFPSIADRIVLITDEGSKLWNSGREKKISTLAIPKNVGGRFSVLSAVGLFPLAAIGIDIEQLQQGAKEILGKCLSENLEENPSAQSAALLYYHHQQGKNIADMFLFNPELESLGKWYRQLMGESIGKEHDVDGKQVFAGMTPTVSIGSTDLHSVAQLYFGGPRDKVTTVVAAKSNIDTMVPAIPFLGELVPHISSIRLSSVMSAIRQSVVTTYKNQSIPVMEVTLDDVSPYSLGQFLQFKMIEMMLLGKLFHVNTFDQPHVELYKAEMKRILAEE